MFDGSYLYAMHQNTSLSVTLTYIFLFPIYFFRQQQPIDEQCPPVGVLLIVILVVDGGANAAFPLAWQHLSSRSRRHTGATLPGGASRWVERQRNRKGIFIINYALFSVWLTSRIINRRNINICMRKFDYKIKATKHTHTHTQTRTLARDGWYYAKWNANVFLGKMSIQINLINSVDNAKPTAVNGPDVRFLPRIFIKGHL